MTELMAALIGLLAAGVGFELIAGFMTWTGDRP